MKSPTPEELTESIQGLRNYRDRLREEFISISQKLRIPNQKINATVEEHPELKRIDKYLEKLISQSKNKID